MAQRTGGRVSGRKPRLSNPRVEVPRVPADIKAEIVETASQFRMTNGEVAAVLLSAHRGRMADVLRRAGFRPVEETVESVIAATAS